MEADLAKYHKREDLELRQKTAYEIMAADQRTLHRQRRTTGFGALWCQVLSTSCHNPAGRWLWCEAFSFRWKQEAHINVLELCPILRDPWLRSCKLVVVVDSQVLSYAVGKGRRCCSFPALDHERMELGRQAL